MQVYLRDGSAQTVLRAATLRQKLQIQLSISPGHSILTLDQPVPALILYRQAPGRVAPGVPVFKSLVWLDPGKLPPQAGFESRIFRSRGGRLNHYADEAVGGGGVDLTHAQHQERGVAKVFFWSKVKGYLEKASHSRCSTLVSVHACHDAPGLDVSTTCVVRDSL